MENWWGKFIFYKQTSEEVNWRFHQNESISIQNLCFAEQPFLWKAVQLGSCWEGLCEAGRGMLARRWFHWHMSTELTWLTGLNFASQKPSLLFLEIGGSFVHASRRLETARDRQQPGNMVGWIFNLYLNVTLSKSFWTLCFVAQILSLYRKAGCLWSCSQQGLMWEVMSVMPGTSQACLIIQRGIGWQCWATAIKLGTCGSYSACLCGTSLHRLPQCLVPAGDVGVIPWILSS